jgi:hypothetical protein
MAQNYSELIFLIPWIILIGIALSMIVNGWAITHEFCGYSKSPRTKRHPEMKEVRKGDELLVIKFTDEDYRELQEIIMRQKMDELFEEPSSYEDEDDDE